MYVGAGNVIVRVETDPSKQLAGQVNLPNPKAMDAPKFVIDWMPGGELKVPTVETAISAGSCPLSKFSEKMTVLQGAGSTCTVSVATELVTAPSGSCTTTEYPPASPCRTLEIERLLLSDPAIRPLSARFVPLNRHW